jgi:penicillin amidase
MQGHTDRFAFGRTNFHIDQEDVFILTLNPDDPEQYRHNGGWRQFERHEDSIAIAGAPPRQITLRSSVHGPVTRHDPAHNRAVAIASVHMGKGGSTMGSMVAINLAQDWDSLIRAVAHHPPPTNLHYADTSGNTGWHAIGYAPERKGHNGLLPVPGDGSFDWQGIRAVADMPSILNPKAGWFASANQDNVPEGTPDRWRTASRRPSATIASRRCCPPSPARPSLTAWPCNMTFIPSPRAACWRCCRLRRR